MSGRFGDGEGDVEGECRGGRLRARVMSKAQAVIERNERGEEKEHAGEGEGDVEGNSGERGNGER
jgi:hypothetical protein